jgi:sulfite reductase (NADPH) flavoprotein alpha-component
MVGRRLINPSSVGGPIFHLRLAPSGAMMPWTAGDIAEIGPRNDPDAVAALLHQLGVTDDADAASLLARHHLPEPAALEGRPPSAWAELLRPLPHREYSIASLPADGAVDLVVRQVRRDDGGLGLGSGWLTRHAPLGCDIALRVRENRSFHPPAEPTPLILIGNGTGIAGLRVHLKHAEAVGSNGHWLLFGERNAAHDRLFADEIAQWRASGLLDRVDLAFSRDQPARVHVQHLLADAGDELRRRVDGGAAIYVCGGLEGMAGAVTRTLVDLIGTDRLHHLIDTQCYRRDVY